MVRNGNAFCWLATCTVGDSGFITGIIACTLASAPRPDFIQCAVLQSEYSCKSNTTARPHYKTAIYPARSRATVVKLLSIAKSTSIIPKENRHAATRYSVNCEFIGLIIPVAVAPTQCKLVPASCASNSESSNDKTCDSSAPDPDGDAKTTNATAAPSAVARHARHDRRS